MSDSLRFSNSEDAKLIEFVSEHPLLWNSSDKSYKNQLLKDTMWKEIGAKIHKTSKQCRVRWRSIRDNFRKQKRQERGTTAPAAKKRASYWDRLSFLDADEDERESISNVMEIMEENSPDFLTPQLKGSPPSSVMEEEATTCRKRKVATDESIEDVINVRRENRQEPFAYSKKLAEPEDEIDLFFKTMAMTVKKFRPALILEAKKRVFQQIIELETSNAI